MPKTRILSIVFVLFTVWAVKTCAPKARPRSAVFFFDDVKYNGNFFETLPLKSPDSTVKRIKDEVPAEWQGRACETTYYCMKEDMPDSIVFRYLDLCDQYFPHDSVYVFTQALRGKHFLRQNKYDKAKACFEASFEFANKLHSLHRIGDAKYMISGLYSRQNNYPEAIKMLQDAYETYSQLPESDSNGQLFETMMSLGNVYRNANDFKSAQVWHQRAWTMARTDNSATGYRILSAAAVANNYLHLNQLDSAKTLIETAFYYQNLYKNNYDEANRYHILAQIQTAQGNCAAALPNLWKATQTNFRKSDLAVIHQYNQAFADAYACLGRLDSAVWYYQQALETPDSAHQAHIHAQLGKVYAQNGNYAKAYTHQLNSQTLSNRAFTIEKDKEIGHLQAQNELQVRERQVIEAENQAKLIRIYVVVAILVLTIGLIVGLFWGYRKKQESRLAQQEKRLAEQEKDFIQQEKERVQQEKELIEARELLKTQALMQAEKDLEDKTEALEQSHQLLDFKNLMIQELEMQLTVKNEPTNRIEDPSILIEPLQNLKILTAEDWRKFRQLFDNRFPTFFSNLTTRLPKLTAAETRLLLLIKIGFDALEISNILGISSASVYTARYRLRKKLGLSEDGDLEKFIEGV